MVSLPDFRGDALETTVALDATALDRQALDVAAWALKQILPLPTAKLGDEPRPRRQLARVVTKTWRWLSSEDSSYMANREKRGGATISLGI